MIGGLRKIFYEKDSFEHVSGKDYQYSLLGRTAIPPTLTFDNERRTIRTEDFTEQINIVWSLGLSTLEPNG